MYYHASSIGGIKVLQPHATDGDIPLIYFSTKRENVLVYLSNAIEKFCKENGFEHHGEWTKWGPYGFDENGILILQEYYPNALIETYDNVSSYIYSAKELEKCDGHTKIPFAETTDKPVEVFECEYVENAYREILSATDKGLIKLLRYDELSPSMHNWLKNTIRKQYQSATDSPDYRFFLKHKFADILHDIT